MKPLFLEPLLEVWALPPRANTTAVRTADFPLGRPQSNRVPVELGWCTNERSAAAYDHHICNGQVPVLIFLLHRCC